MATKSSIHIKPCKTSSSEAHNRRSAEYMRNIGKSQIYIVPELTANNEQWINPGFGNPDLQAHYDLNNTVISLCEAYHGDFLSF